MDFDLASAQPVQPQSSSFDLASAKPVPATAPAPAFDLASAKAERPDPHAGETASQRLARGHADPNHPNLWNVVYGLQGAYQESSMNGLLTQPTRFVMEHTGVGMNQLKARYPNQTDDWYKRHLHQAYNDAITAGREEAVQKVQDNPYAGQAIGNVAAGIVGRPELLLAPGAGRGSGLVGGIARSAAAGGAIMGVSNTAAQIMDVAEGQKKDFDVQQMLNESMGGALFGGAVHGAIEAAPPVANFVKDLFKTRGMDTTPSADPRATTSPMTTERPTLSPEDHTQLKQLIRTGSVDDIKGFLATKQGPKPTWTDVNNLVEARDAVPDNAVQRYKDALDQHLEDTHSTVVKDHFENQMADWANKPDVEVVNRAEDIADPTARADALAKGLNHENTVGYFGPDGKVRVFAGAVKTPEQASAVLFHEGLGHFSLAQKFGIGLDKTLDSLAARNVSQFGKAVDDWQKKNPKAYGGNRTRAAEEVLAEMSEKGPLKKSLGDALDAHVRRFGRRMGMKLSYSDAEVRNILAMSHDAIVNGKGSDVSGNGFKFKRTEQDDISDNPWQHPDKNPFVPAKGDLLTSDVEQLMREHADDAEQYQPEGALPEEDVNQMMSEDTGPKFMTPEQLERHSDDPHAEAFRKFEDGYVPRFRSVAEAKEAAKNTALDASQIRKSKSVGHIDRKLFVYDNAAIETNAKLIAMAEKDEQGLMTNDELVNMAETINDFHYVLGRLDNDLGESARATATAKHLTFRRNNILALKKLLEEEGSPLGAVLDPETASKFLKQFAALAKSGKNPAGAGVMLKQVNKPYWEQYVLTWRNNMLLSGLSTHLKNPMDMATTMGRELEEKLAALPMGAVRDIARSLGMKNVQQGVHPAEVAAQVQGMFRALISSSTWSDASNAFTKGGYQRFAGTGIQSPRIPIVSKVQDALAAMDVFFRAIFDNGNLYALGVREARKSGLKTWDDITVAAAGHAAMPTKAMLDEARELTEHTMLINKSSLNDALDAAKRYKPGMDGAQRVAKFGANYLTPFVRVQTNALVNQVVRRSPLGYAAMTKWGSFIDPKTRADWVAGGARRDIAIMRSTMGSLIMAYYWHMAGQKTTDQGPAGNYNKLQELEASGWRPGAVHDKGRFNVNSNLNLSLFPWDTHNNVASMVAGVRESYDKGVSKGNVGLSLKLAGATIMSYLTNQTFVNDIGEAWDAFHDPDETGAKKMERFIGNEEKTFLPNATTQAAKIIDPVARNTSENPVLDVPRSAIPFASRGLPAQHSAYGEEKQTGTSITGVHTWLNSGNGQNEVTDPAHIELARLGSLFRETIVSPVQRTIKLKDNSQFPESQLTDSGEVRLTASQFEEYQRVAGREITERMRDKMQDSSWTDMSDEDKAKWVRKMSADSKKAARESLYGNAGSE